MIEVLKQALEFIERVNKDGWILADFEPQMYKTITAIKDALAQPEQEPVAYLVLFEGAGKLLEFTKGNYLHGAKVEHIPLYTTPPQRTWIGLMDEEVLKFQDIVPNSYSIDLIAFAKAIEAKLKEKNT